MFSKGTAYNQNTLPETNMRSLADVDMNTESRTI